MITEDYVSFETAKLLKEKGFDTVKCQNSPHFSYNIDGQFSGPSWDSEYNAPTLQMAMKWLREIHHIMIDIYYDDSDDSRWVSEYYDNNLRDYVWITVSDIYEEAAEAAIKYCLENLI